MSNDLLLVFLLGAVLAVQHLTIRGYTVVADSPAVLVLEEKRGPRYLAAIGLAIIGGVFYFGEVNVDAPLGFGLRVGNAIPLVALVAAAVALRLFERVRIVLDSATGTVERTSRFLPWRRFRRPTGDIDRIDVSSRTTTMYGQDSGADHYVHLVFRHGRRLLVDQSADRAFIVGVAARIEARRKGHDS